MATILFRFGRRVTIRLAVFCATAIVAALTACSGGSARAPSITPATPATGFLAATGPVTLLNGAAGGFASTVFSPASTALFLTQNAATPDAVVGAGTLPSTLVTVSELAGTAPQTVQRSARSVRPVHGVAREPENDIRPDRIDVAAGMRAIAGTLRRTATHVRSTQATQRAVQFAFKPADAFTFQLQGGTISGTSGTQASIAVAAHLITQTAHANVWLDDTDANASEYPSGVQADMDIVGQRFEENFSVETLAFGSPYTTQTAQFQECDATGAALTGSQSTADPGTDTTGKTDPQINIVITSALAGTGEGGYFFGADMLSQSEANCIPGTPKIRVNNLKMIVMASDKYVPSPNFAANNEPYWLLEVAPQTLAHEYQHYVHYINKFLQQIVAQPTNPSAGTIDDAFVDEGCSVLAQDLVVEMNQRNPLEKQSPIFVRLFLIEPDLFSLTAFSGFQPDPSGANAAAGYGYYRNTSGNYGLSYLFIRYLYDRFGGVAALHRLYAETATGGGAIDVGPAIAAANGEGFAQLYLEFASAVAIHAGGTIPEIASDPRFTFSPSVILRGPTPVYSRRISANTRTIVQGGPENPEVFAGAQPLIDANGYVREVLRPGQTLTLRLISGATAFLTASGSPPGGATIRANGSAANFQGSLVQGAIPTPTASF